MGTGGEHTSVSAVSHTHTTPTHTCCLVDIFFPSSTLRLASALASENILENYTQHNTSHVTPYTGPAPFLSPTDLCQLVCGVEAEAVDSVGSVV